MRCAGCALLGLARLVDVVEVRARGDELEVMARLGTKELGWTGPASGLARAADDIALAAESERRAS